MNDEPNYKIRIEVYLKIINQYHHKRSEAWTIVQGTASVTLEGKISEHSKGETIIIPQGFKHRVQNKGLEKLVFIEVQTGTYFGEDDIVRIEDDYNRIK